MSEAAPARSREGRTRAVFRRIADNDALASFLASPVTVAAGLVAFALFAVAALAPWIAPTDPFDPATNFLSNSLTPPALRRGRRSSVSARNG
jgi:peptide/nickel transport system permease protein